MNNLLVDSVSKGSRQRRIYLLIVSAAIACFLGGELFGNDDQTKQIQNNNVKRPRNPFQVQIVYSPKYLINLGGLEKLHPFDIHKYSKIHKQLVADQSISASHTLSPESLTSEQLRLIHSDEYLETLKDKEMLIKYLEAPALKFAPLNLEKAVVEPFRFASGGTLLAARSALDVGIGINIGGGYHHAKPTSGEGFCLFADIPIAIRQLQADGHIKKALIVDVDVHQGNGTILCLPNDDSTFTFSMHQAEIYPIPKEMGDLDVEVPSGCQDEEFNRLLSENLQNILKDFQPDICFIVGGCDTLQGDPLASLEMTPQGIVDRDALIVRTCVDKKIPVVLTLAGGYSKDAWKAQHQSIKNIIETYGVRK
ncbi:MAG: histone deacetylase [Pirellula sp.]|nr:histone deacetylase [Pirellula sp.]